MRPPLEQTHLVVGQQVGDPVHGKDQNCVDHRLQQANSGAKGHITVSKTGLIHVGRDDLGNVDIHGVLHQVSLLVADRHDGTKTQDQHDSDGGHNGLKHIAATLGTTSYARLRFGVGNDFGKGRQVQFVLGTFDATDEQPVIDEQVPVAVEIIKSFCHIGLARTMNVYNQKGGAAK